MYEKEINALTALEPTANLLAQITEWRRPGKYSFKSDFPVEHEQWVRTSRIFRRSKDRDFRAMGDYMCKFNDVITELDELPEDSRKFRRKIAEFRRILDRGIKIMARLANRMVIA